RLPLGNATQPFKEDTLVEGHDERDNRLHWEVCGIDVIIGQRLREGLGEYRAPLSMNLRQAFLQLGTIPRERLKLQPYLLIPTREILVEIAHGRSPLLQKGYVSRIHR